MKLELSLEEINIILEALGEQQLKKVVSVFNKIHAQVNSQLEENKEKNKE